MSTNKATLKRQNTALCIAEDLTATATQSTEHVIQLLKGIQASIDGLHKLLSEFLADTYIEDLPNDIYNES